jgi:3-deoxy-7-phosphoheptulonate synthase
VQTYYGDLINGQELKQREPNPMRMLLGYQTIKQTMHTLATTGTGLNSNFFTMHEAYNLPFERALLRHKFNKTWASTGHILWVGARTNHPKYAHIQFIKSTHNPVGIKISPTLTPQSLQEILNELSDRPSPIMLIIRLGCHKTAKFLPALIRAIGKQRVFWILDPMHGNTIRLTNGKKTRLINEMKQEIYDTANILKKFDQRLSDIHLELTANKVLECVDTLENSSNKNDFDANSIICDPRLNPMQAEQLVDTYLEVLP